MKISAVLFDLDGVLADVDYHAAAAFFGQLLPISLPELGRVWQRWLEERAGSLTDVNIWSRFWDDLADRFMLPPPARQSLHAFDYRSLYRAYPDAMPALGWARQHGLRVGVLSNTPLLDLRELLAALGLAELVDCALFPQSTGLAKPAPAAYRHALAALEVSAEQCLFFDDEPANVDGARAVGVRSFRVLRRADPEKSLAPAEVRTLDMLASIVSGADGGA